jgi:hypothetical protein
VEKLCDVKYTRLPRNVVNAITHPRAPKALTTLFTCNRSFQEKLGEYKTVPHYFKHFFQDADICFLSSHTTGSSVQHVASMVSELKRRCYNVGGIFWSNGFDANAKQMAEQLPWSEVFWIENPPLTNPHDIKAQLEQRAKHFADMLVARAYAQ